MLVAARLDADAQPLGPAYFRVFQFGPYFYAIVRGGSVLRSLDPYAPFEQGPRMSADLRWLDLCEARLTGRKGPPQ